MLYKSLSDPDLTIAIINDDVKAFNELFDRHWARVYAVAYKFVKDEELSLEITHDIFLNIWNKRQQLHINSFKNYVTTAASYHSMRKKQTLKAVPLHYVEDFSLTERENNIGQETGINEGETNISKQEFDNRVDTLLNDLPKRCKEIYLLSRRDNLTITEIAAQFNISKRTVENQLTAALKHLRTSLQYAMIVFSLLKGL
jgi:RNA polymerase sigma-70 factor (ECF subfamily)